jgi:tagatose 1,6-diphosphate aldolase
MIPFQKTGKLLDDDLELRVTERFPGNIYQRVPPAYRFRMVHPSQPLSYGHIELRLGSEEPYIRFNGHVGYVVWPGYRGNRYAARSIELLRPLAKDHYMDGLWITCAPDNAPSRRTCELVGARLVEIISLPPDLDYFRPTQTQLCRYWLTL